MSSMRWRIAKYWREILGVPAPCTVGSWGLRGRYKEKKNRLVCLGGVLWLVWEREVGVSGSWAASWRGWEWEEQASLTAGCLICIWSTSWLPVNPPPTLPSSFWVHIHFGHDLSKCCQLTWAVSIFSCGNKTTNSDIFETWFLSLRICKQAEKRERSQGRSHMTVCLSFEYISFTNPPLNTTQEQHHPFQE